MPSLGEADLLNREHWRAAMGISEMLNCMRFPQSLGSVLLVAEGQQPRGNARKLCLLSSVLSPELGSKVGRY